MRELAHPLPVPAKRDAFAAVGPRVALTWETAAWAAVIVAAFGLRVWGLGARAMRLDESQVAYDSYQLLLGHGYEHNPALHGPSQYFGTAATFFLAGGASDVSTRLLPALFGGAVVMLPLLFRSHLGRAGALATAVLIALSPTLLYYSRFAGADIYAALFTLGIVICVWRYIEKRRTAYLYGAAALLALSFATKETTFVFVALILVFLDLWVALDFARSGERRGAEGTGIRFLAYAPFAWLLSALWPFIGLFRRLLGREHRTLPAVEMLLVLGTLAAPQFAAAFELPLEAAGVEINSAAEERAVAVPVVLGLVGASAAVGLAWRPRVWLTAALCFYVPYTLLFTAFLTDIEGLGSGIWESLDHRLEQEEVAAATQPDFYYLMFWPAYEYLALAVAGPALLYFCLRGGPRSWLLTATTVVALLFAFGADSFDGGTSLEIAQYAMLPIAGVGLFAAVRGTMFGRFLVFWTAASLVAYSLIGEKMPWLSIHVAQPLVLLAGYTIGKLFGDDQLDRVGDRRPGGSRPRSFATILAVPATLVLAVLAVFSARTAVFATFDHGDVAREFLFYAPSSPDVPDIVERVDHIAEASGRRNSLRIQVDQEEMLPWAWYLRDYDVSFDRIGEGFAPATDAVLLVSAQNERFVADFIQDYQLPEHFTLRGAFPEDYRDVGDKDNLAEGIADFVADLGESDTWERWWDFWFHRDTMPAGETEGRLFVPLEFEAVDVGPLTSGRAGRDRGTPADIEGRAIIGELGSEPGQLLLPTGVAIDTAKNIYVVDTGNSRLQKFDDRGSPAGAVGTVGGEPGQFNQPSDVAVDAAGNVYVADTWNHRIQKFAPDLAPLHAWGQATRDLVNPSPDQLWAPGGIAIDQVGNVLVADTGTNRIRKYNADGGHLGDFGRRGREPGEFDGPTDVAVGPDGSVYVADAGNSRIQRFDPSLRFSAAWTIEDWGERQLGTSLQIAVLPDGRVLATDATHRRLLLIAGEGRVSARLETAVDAPLFSVDGVAFDAERRLVYVTDGLAGHVRRFPFTDFALR